MGYYMAYKIVSKLKRLSSDFPGEKNLKSRGTTAAAVAINQEAA